MYPCLFVFEYVTISERHWTERETVMVNDVLDAAERLRKTVQTQADCGIVAIGAMYQVLSKDEIAVWARG